MGEKEAELKHEKEENARLEHQTRELQEEVETLRAAAQPTDPPVSLADPLGAEHTI